MPEELQQLLERIQKDGVNKAEAQAADITSSAQEKADTIIKKARDDANAIVEQAKHDAEQFYHRSAKALQQAARDIILSIGEALRMTLKELTRKEVSSVMTGDALGQMLTKVIESYYGQKSGNTHIRILLNEEEQKRLAGSFATKFANELASGLEIKGDNNIISGFRVLLKDQNIEHDFTSEAVTESLCQIIQPYLAEIVKKASGSVSGFSQNNTKRTEKPEA